MDNNEDFGEIEDYEGMTFSFNNDHDWDEIIHSYGFDNIDESNYGRFGSQRAQDNDIIYSQTSAAQRAVDNMFGKINLKSLRPKLMLKTLPFLFPGIKKCVHTKVIKMCIHVNLRKKKVALSMIYIYFLSFCKI